MLKQAPQFKYFDESRSCALPLPVYGDGNNTDALLHDPRCRILLHQTRTAILEWNVSAGYVFLSPDVKQFAFSSELSDTPLRRLFREGDVHPDDWQQAAETFSTLLGPDADLTLRLLRTDGRYLWYRVMRSRLTTSNGELSVVLITINNVHEAVAARRVLAYRAEYDSLTGYSNLASFKKSAVERLLSRGRTHYALLYCDIRNFKYVNDIYGYVVGDHVLQFLADTLAAACHDDEHFARITADKFVILLRYENQDQIIEWFYRLENRLTDFGELKSQKFRLELVGGVYCATYGEDALGIDDMIDRANMAQKTVKPLGGSHISFYSEEMRQRVIREKSMEADMEQALSAHEFEIYLQAQVDIQNGCRVVGAEALVRWKRPEFGLTPPNDFIPLFEKNGFIVDLDRYVFEGVCSYLADRRDAGLPLFKVAVNVSRLSLFQADFVQRYTHIRQQYGLPDNLLELECTETVMVENIAKIGHVAEALRKSGFLVGMDDFGAGYSSLNVLKDLFVDVLKLDMAFFQNGLTAQRDRAIVSSVISMAKKLGMRVVAEGVEVPEMVSFLHDIGCDMIQGYVFSRPVSLSDFKPEAIYPFCAL